MVYNSLLDLITYLQYGTKLHIGVLFFGNYGNEKCILPSEQTIHASKICDEFKGRDGGLEKCFRCRNAAIRKAHCTKTVFGGLCINGVYIKILGISKRCKHSAQICGNILKNKGICHIFFLARACEEIVAQGQECEQSHVVCDKH